MWYAHRFAFHRFVVTLFASLKGSPDDLSMTLICQLHDWTNVSQVISCDTDEIDHNKPQKTHKARIVCMFAVVSVCTEGERLTLRQCISIISDTDTVYHFIFIHSTFWTDDNNPTIMIYVASNSEQFLSYLYNI